MPAPLFGLVSVQPQHGNPFDLFPQLSSIWRPDLAAIAKEAVDEAFDAHRTHGHDYGAIFIVTHPEDPHQVWGLTGYLPWPAAGDGLIPRVGLRWHGLLPEVRGHGLSMAIIDTMRMHAGHDYPLARHFVEYMPTSPDYAPIAQYFERAGFVPWGEPERVDWSTDTWQEWACDIRTPLQLTPPEPSGPNP